MIVITKPPRRDFIDAGVLREFLIHDGRDPGLQADITGITDRSIRRVIFEGQLWVHLSVADQLITRLGGTFELEYPLEGESR